MNNMRIAYTKDNLTPLMIRRARDAWPDLVSSERSANALGLPESYTDGGLPIYPDKVWINADRAFIARVINDKGLPDAEA